MSSASFDHAVAFCQTQEGGYSDDPRDAGNWYNDQLIGSMWGVSAPTLAQWIAPEQVTPDLMEGLSVATMAAIYRASYWNPCGGDGLAPGVDLMVVDHGYNAGNAASLGLLSNVNALSLDVQCAKISTSYAKTLQTYLGVTRDGVIGPQTTAAIRAQSAQTLVLIFALSSAQSAYYHGLSQFPTYGAGWLSRVAARTVASAKLYRGVGT